jgi:hypothetical protein
MSRRFLTSPVKARREGWSDLNLALFEAGGVDLAGAVHGGGRRRAVGRRGARLLQLLDIGSDMHVSRRVPPQPVEEFDGGTRIGAPRVRIPDLRGEEFKETIGRTRAGGGDESVGDGAIRAGRVVICGSGQYGAAHLFDILNRLFDFVIHVVGARPCPPPNLVEKRIHVLSECAVIVVIIEGFLNKHTRRRTIVP